MDGLQSVPKISWSRLRDDRRRVELVCRVPVLCFVANHHDCVLKKSGKARAKGIEEALNSNSTKGVAGTEWATVSIGSIHTFHSFIPCPLTQIKRAV